MPRALGPGPRREVAPPGNPTPLPSPVVKPRGGSPVPSVRAEGAITPCGDPPRQAAAAFRDSRIIQACWATLRMLFTSQ
ncbi:hypothetical protein JCM30394_28860 [Deferrisoma palaeochoriense]